MKTNPPIFEKDAPHMLIGLSGTLGSGKDTVASHLVNEHGFMHVSTGDVLRIEAKRQGRDTERPTLIEIGMRLRKLYGSLGALCLKGIAQWDEQRESFPGGLVVSGIRVVGEAEEIQDQNGTLVFIDAPVEERYRRLIARARDYEVSKTFDEFVAHEEIELHGLGGANSPHLRAIEAIADTVLQNTGTEADIIGKIDTILGFSTPPSHSVS